MTSVDCFAIKGKCTMQYIVKMQIDSCKTTCYTVYGRNRHKLIFYKKQRVSKMKIKLFATCMAVCMFLAFLSVQALAQEESAERIYVYVTVCDQNGALVLAREEITVRDLDGDGIYTMDEALRCAHEAHYQGGADGYASEQTAYGTSMTKLWGVENNGAFGYYLNQTSPQSLEDAVKQGDEIDTFVYTDLDAFGDTYCFFDKTHVAVSGKEKLTLTLVSYSYEENWNTVTVPVANAKISIDGKSTAFVTDEDGKVTLSFDGTGYCVVSASKDGALLVPPVCAVAVSSNKLPAGDGSLLLWAALLVASLVTVYLIKKHTRHAL